MTSVDDNDTEARMAGLRDRVAHLSDGRYGVRPDSVLAKRYASGELLRDPRWQGHDDLEARVARRLVETMFAYDATGYHAACEAVYPHMANAIKRDHPALPWTRVWEIVKRHAPDVVRPLAIAEAGYDYAAGPPFKRPKQSDQDM